MRIHGLKKAAGLTIAALATLGAFSTAYAITNGRPDGNTHPYVGLIAVYDDAGHLAGWASGELLSPKVFLTAAHVTSSVTKIENVRIFFNEVPSLDPNDGIQAAEVHTHPDFRIGGHSLPGFDTHDVGVVILKEEVILAQYAELPALGLVDALAAMSPLDLVGYGVQFQVRGGGVRPYNAWRGGLTRYHAPSQLVPSNDVLSDEFIQVTTNPAQGKGGGAFGDSGSPALLRNTAIVLAVCSFVTNPNCAGLDYYCRVDTEDVLDWLHLFL